MNRLRWHRIVGLVVLLTAAPPAWAQQQKRNPHIGYVYPAGGRQGTTFEVTVGGQYLAGASQVIVSGEGVEAAVSEYTKPLTPKQINELRQKLQELRKRVQAQRKKEGKAGKRIQRGEFKSYEKIARELGVTEEDLKIAAELRKQRSDPKRQPNPGLAEKVALRITLAQDAEPGPRELRLVTAAGLSNPLNFHVGQLPEHRETEPNDTTPDAELGASLPLILNGQIMPGDVDRFRFDARKGQRLVVATSARALIPYLADAVPGWFQATAALYDAKGNEVAFADDYRFHPDPVLHYEIPEDGRYVLEIRDAIYRGREDFVYRVTLGEVPFVTGIFPLGGRDGVPITVRVKGWNLPTDRLTLDAETRGPGIHPVSVRDRGWISNRVPFAVDSLPEALEREPNDDQRSAQRVEAPVIVNGRIDRPGDWDLFCFEGRAGDRIVAEVQARRLNSPLDSLLRLTDASGRQWGINDDSADKGAGLTTHQADSRLSVTLAADGTYYLYLGDTQHKGGPDYAYRLRISPPRPDFQLRVVPASVNARAGASVPITVYALRRDGFAGDISLELKDAPSGFALSGAWVPADQDKVRLTLTAPRIALEGPCRLHLEGRAMIEGREVRRVAVAAEDMMQAFFYRHLVPSGNWMVAVDGRWLGRGRARGRARSAVRLLGKTPVRISAGEVVEVRFAVPAGPLVNQVRLALSESPDGVAIEKVLHPAEGLAVRLRADAEKVKPGTKGNLIVEAFLERAGFGKNPKQRSKKRRIALGPLPAVPFEIVAAAPGTSEPHGTHP